LWRQEEKLFFKNQNQNQKQKQKQKPRQIVATQKRKKMKKGVVAAALVHGAQQNFARNKGPKIKIKIATRSLRNKHARKVHENCTLPERAQKAKGEIHTKFRGEKKDPQINK
jgi:peptidyl-tRNA hydrolase